MLPWASSDPRVTSALRIEDAELLGSFPPKTFLHICASTRNSAVSGAGPAPAASEASGAWEPRMRGGLEALSPLSERVLTATSPADPVPWAADGYWVQRPWLNPFCR